MSQSGNVLKPGDMIGILGSGQLGRMIALAAARLGIRSHIYCPESGPAFDVCAQYTMAPYDDEKALAAFADSVAIVSYEFENVPAKTAAFLQARRPVRPNPRALAITQDRFTEKSFLNDLGIPTAPFAQVDNLADLEKAVAALGRPSVLKTRRFGYDGKGQTMIRETSHLAEAFASVGSGACILEGFVPFQREVSVIGARGLDGSFAAYDVCENEHANHILSRTIVPAQAKPDTQAKAIDMAGRIAAALDYVGVITVEMFLVEEAAGERIVVNEIAPRVHNSGHWTIDGAVTSQFEQHVRAICGWPLGAPRRHGRIEMHNLIGSQAHDWASLLATDGVALHLYGKHEAREGRKMGHWTRVLPE
jgi:5-(carboxyamino)imidazole ribonucleotide synthase